jgi:prepilin-type N-terminal cleavage/methylation domain-containing protein
MNSMKAKKRKGFTLMEVVTAMGISAIVILAGGAVLVASHTRWNKAWDDVNLQRDASYTMLELTRSIRACASATVEADGAAIRMYDRDGAWELFSLGTGADNIQFEIEGQSPRTIIDRNLEGLQFNIEGNRVTIDLKLKKDNQQINLVSTVLMRNYGG